MGEAFAVGTQEVAQVSFKVSSVVTNVTTLAFGNAPVLSQTADTGANPLPTTYVNGTLAIWPLVTMPTLQLALTPDNTSVVVSWPAGASGFLLESSTDLNLSNWGGVNAVMVTNINTISTTIAITNAQQFFRLHHH